VRIDESGEGIRQASLRSKLCGRGAGSEDPREWLLDDCRGSLQIAAHRMAFREVVLQVLDQFADHFREPFLIAWLGIGECPAALQRDPRQLRAAGSLADTKADAARAKRAHYAAGF